MPWRRLQRRCPDGEEDMGRMGERAGQEGGTGGEAGLTARIATLVGGAAGGRGDVEAEGAEPGAASLVCLQ